jgi:hypothetical protein
MKNNIISETDITEILSMHKSLKEQNETNVGLDVSADVVQLRKAITAGCLKGGKILTNANQTKYVYRATTKSGKIVDFTADMNYKFEDGSKSGKWKCDEIAQMADKAVKMATNTAKEETNLTNLKNEYKNKYGAQEFSEIQFKTKADDPTFYKKIPFKGVDTGFLYIPNKDREFLAVSYSGYTKDTPQYEILKALTDKGYILNPTPLEKTSFRKVKFENEELGGLFPNGIVAYIDPKKLFAKTTTDGSVLDNATSVINTKECKEFINQYWENYRDDDAGTEVDFTKLKAQVMACKKRYYPNRWGLLGLAGNQIDKKIDVLSRKANEYDGLTTPSRTSKWLLN